jgi:hypothetical protein
VAKCCNFDTEKNSDSGSSTFLLRGDFGVFDLQIKKEVLLVASLFYSEINFKILHNYKRVVISTPEKRGCYS